MPQSTHCGEHWYSELGRIHVCSPEDKQCSSCREKEDEDVEVKFTHEAIDRGLVRSYYRGGAACPAGEHSCGVRTQRIQVYTGKFTIGKA